MEVRSDPACSKPPIVVGFEARKKEIIDALLDPSNLKLSIVRIVGPPGVGKTYLAKEIYTSVQNHFDVLQWLGFYGYRSYASTAGYSPPTDLYGKRYFIVYDNYNDDYLDSYPWITQNLPDDNNGSRIVVTSRRENVNWRSPNFRQYKVGLRSDEESLEILRQTAFPILKDHSEGCAELFGLAKQLVAKCWGLPWPLRFLGGLLSVQPPPYTNSWSEVLDRIEADEAGGMVFVKFAMRYRDLPNHKIRAAFLYFLTFPEDAEIQAKSLVDLLKVEGFARNREDGMAILKYLAERSMIEVTKWCFDGSIKCCRLHDPLLRWLAIHEAKEKRFVSVRTVSLYRDDPSDPIIRDLYNAQIGILPDQVKSDYSPRAKKIDVAQLADASCIFNFGKNFPLNTVLKSVRVLEIDYTRSTQQIEEERGRASNNIANIRYMVVKNSTLSPENFDRLLTVRTLRIRHLSLRNTKVREIAKLPEHLETLDVGEELRSLKIQGSNVPARIIDVATYPHGMSFLKDLWIGGSHSRFILNGIKLPSSLITITLENLEFKKDPMIILEKLQHLKNLRLRWLWYTSQNKTMTCSTGKFPQLEMLQLYHISGLEEWSVQQRALPKITHVVIQSCKALKDLSNSLVRRMNPLNELHLISMPPRFTSSFSKHPFVKISEN
ncbi:hypothetical protein LUZ61_009018 [Rhynchospora tenuis]|uniref:NB-ARC domain-containing protein n=1 Tax=Rhynchospora tenuis TaxID=198213 RepID=A0AAD6EY75_9POAL|nr:hypothetical protein LUZ61_009018 [Rhynchospora tenuis]